MRTRGGSLQAAFSGKAGGAGQDGGRPLLRCAGTLHPGQHSELVRPVAGVLSSPLFGFLQNVEHFMRYCFRDVSQLRPLPCLLCLALSPSPSCRKQHRVSLPEQASPVSWLEQQHGPVTSAQSGRWPEGLRSFLRLVSLVAICWTWETVQRAVRAGVETLFVRQNVERREGAALPSRFLDVRAAPGL